MSGTRVLCSLACLLLLSTGCASIPPGSLIDKGLPNFHRVDTHLSRGGQPLPEGYAELSKMGVDTVIDLRGSGDDPSTRKDEQRAVEAEHIQYIPERMSGLGAPSQDAVRRVLSVINDPQRKSVFIHCRRGADRTGTVVAIYRVTHDCWTADQAIQEARERGMLWIEFGMRRLIREWYEEVKEQGCKPGG